MKKENTKVHYFILLDYVTKNTQVSEYTTVVFSLRHNLVKHKILKKICVHFINPMTFISFTHTEKHDNCPIKLTQSSTLSANNGRGFMWQFIHNCSPQYLLSFYSKYTLCSNFQRVSKF